MSVNTAEEEHANALVAAGAVLRALSIAGVDTAEPVIVDGVATGEIRFGFMNSTYRITVERIPGTEQAEAADGG